MPLHKKTVSGDITDTLTYIVPDADAYGAQVTDVRFYDAQGDIVTPTDGTYSLEWTPNGRDWSRFHSALSPVNASSGIGDWQVSGFIHSLRAVPTGITGATTWEVSYRTHGIGYSFPHHTIAPLRFFDRIRTIGQTLSETATLEGDAYRIYAYLGEKSNLVDLGDDLPSIPGSGSAWFSLQYSDTKLTALSARVITLFSGAGLKYIAYAPGSPFDGSGTPIQVRNLENNLGPTNPADVQVRFLEVTTGNNPPAQFTGATEIDFSVVPADGSGGGRKGGELINSQQFIIVPLGGSTLVQIFNQANVPVEVEFELQIIETET